MNILRAKRVQQIALSVCGCVHTHVSYSVVYLDRPYKRWSVRFWSWTKRVKNKNKQKNITTLFYTFQDHIHSKCPEDIVVLLTCYWTLEDQGSNINIINIIGL